MVMVGLIEKRREERRMQRKGYERGEGRTVVYAGFLVVSSK